MTTMILTRYHIHIFAMAIGVGIITKIGSSVKNLQIGDRVGKKDSSWINSQICTYHMSLFIDMHISYVLFSYSYSYA